MVRIATDDGPALAKGTLVKEEHRIDKPKYDQDGNRIGTDVTVLEKLVTHVTTTRPDGTITTIATAADVAEFMTKHGSVIADALLTRNTPTYNFKPLGKERAITTKIARACLPCPDGKNAACSPCKPTLASRARECCANTNTPSSTATQGWARPPPPSAQPSKSIAGPS